MDESGPYAANVPGASNGQTVEGEIRAVIFDIGGVLEITHETGWREDWSRRLGLELDELIDLIEPNWRAGDVGGVTLDEVERGVAEALGLDDAELWLLMEAMWAEYLGTLNDELVTYFAGLRPRYRTGILSNSFVGARERERSAYGFEDLCDVVVYSHEEGVKKPDALAYKIVCQRLGVLPTQAVMLDDVPTCVEGARAVGMRAVRFVDNRRAITELESVLGRARRAMRREGYG
jgi:epoxide hydrolase-like predicted phosphatase